MLRHKNPYVDRRHKNPYEDKDEEDLAVVWDIKNMLYNLDLFRCNDYSPETLRLLEAVDGPSHAPIVRHTCGDCKW